MTELRAVDNQNSLEPIDTWLLPEELLEGVTIEPKRFQGPRQWQFDPRQLLLLPMPAMSIGDIVSLYRENLVLTHAHMLLMQRHCRDLPEAWQQFKLFFLGDRFRNKNGDWFVYAINLKDGACSVSEESFDSKGTKEGRLLMLKDQAPSK